MVKVDIDDVLQGLIQPIGALKGGFDHPVTSADQIWVYTDPSTHVPLDEYLDSLGTGTADITGFFVSNATALTDGKITKASIVGGDVNKCKIGDIVLVADGGIYKIKAVDETNLTLVDNVLSAIGGVNFLQATLDEPDVFGHSEGTYTGTIDPNKVNVAILPDPKNKYTILTNITDEGVGSATIITDRQSVTLYFANNEIHTSPAGTYGHYSRVISDTVDIILNYYSTDGYRYSDLEELKNRFQGRLIPCSGFVKINNKFQNARGIDLRDNTIIYFDNDTGKNASIDLTGRIEVYDQVVSVETGMEVGNFDPGPL